MPSMAVPEWQSLMTDPFFLMDRTINLLSSNYLWTLDHRSDTYLSGFIKLPSSISSSLQYSTTWKALTKKCLFSESSTWGFIWCMFWLRMNITLFASGQQTVSFSLLLLKAVQTWNQTGELWCGTGLWTTTVHWHAIWHARPVSHLMPCFLPPMKYILLAPFKTFILT